MTLSIAIVGAGIGGLSCALALQRLGFEPTVYEQAGSLGDVGAGIGLWPGAIASLRAIGVSAWFWQLPVCRFRWAETATPDGRRLAGFDVSGMTGGDGFVVRRADLHRALAEQLDPSRIVLGARAISIEGVASQAVVRFAGDRNVTADAVVGADGLRSVVRAVLWGDAAPRYSGETCYRGIADFAVADTGMLREVQGTGQRCAVHPLDVGQVYWWATRRTPEGGREAPGQRKDTLRRLFDGWQFGFPAALAATPADAILRNDLYDRPALRKWSRGPVTLLGDAAHPTTPNLGLGGCMAIEDALVLARNLAEQRGDAVAAFAGYERERSDRTSRVVRMSRWFGRIGSVRGRGAVTARELIMRATPTPVLARSFAAAVGLRP